VGGYITFAGGHRLLDAGVTGRAALPQVTTSAVSGILIASLIRVGLFLASLGIVSQGLAIDAGNPPASVFQLAAGHLGYKIFGIVMFSAAITSVIGSAYTSVSFIKSFHPAIDRQQNRVIVAFILLSTLIFVTVGKPIHLLILAGSLNGFILPVTLGTILVAAHRRNVVGDYRHPWWLTFFGLLVVGVMTWMGGMVLINQLPRLFGGGAG
jgi:Mn2+/Fe2+ NRAMP family transporter